MGLVTFLLNNQRSTLDSHRTEKKSETLANISFQKYKMSEGRKGDLLGLESLKEHIREFYITISLCAVKHFAYVQCCWDFSIRRYLKKFSDFSWSQEVWNIHTFQPSTQSCEMVHISILQSKAKILIPISNAVLVNWFIKVQDLHCRS